MRPFPLACVCPHPACEPHEDEDLALHTQSHPPQGLLRGQSCCPSPSGTVWLWAQRLSSCSPPSTGPASGLWCGLEQGPGFPAKWRHRVTVIHPTLSCLQVTLYAGGAVGRSQGVWPVAGWGAQQLPLSSGLRSTCHQMGGWHGALGGLEQSQRTSPNPAPSTPSMSKSWAHSPAPLSFLPLPCSHNLPSFSAMWDNLF